MILITIKTLKQSIYEHEISTEDTNRGMQTFALNSGALETHYKVSYNLTTVSQAGFSLGWCKMEV